MNTNTLLDFDHLTPEQQQKLNDLFAGIQYLREDAWNALYSPDLMTQELFDSIQLRRMEIGPELENIALDMFLRYPDFAEKYGERLDKAMESASEGYDAIRKGILDEFGYDIGDCGKE